MTGSDYARDRQALVLRETSCHSLVSSFLARIEDARALNAFLHVDAGGALAAADDIDRRLADGAELPLAGLVLAVKDLICVGGLPVTCGSRILTGFTSLIESTAVERLRAAGAVIIGKTNCDEFGMGSSNENSAFGPVSHPTAPGRVPGGSSGGSAAAVAAGLCHAALGTDTGGSIRQPAAFCGIVGLKPTYGRVSRWGLVAYASSFDTIGPMSPDARLAAQMLSVMAGPDARDATSTDHRVAAYERAVDDGVRGMRIGLPDEYFAEGLDPDVREVVMEAVSRLEAAGATIRRVSLPHTRYGIAAYYVLTTAEASSNLARYDGVRYGQRADAREVLAAIRAERADIEANAGPGEREARLAALPSALEAMYTRTRTEGFGDEVKRRIMLGTYVLSSGYYDAYYARAQRARARIRADFDEAFAHVDLLAAPAAPHPAFWAGSHERDPLAMYLEDVYTVGASLAGLPALSIPVGGARQGDITLPVGLQFIAPMFEEERLFRASGLLEAEAA